MQSETVVGNLRCKLRSVFPRENISREDKFLSTIGGRMLHAEGIAPWGAWLWECGARPGTVFVLAAKWLHFFPKMSPLGHRDGRRIPGEAWSPVHSGGDELRSPRKGQEMPQEWHVQETGSVPCPGHPVPPRNEGATFQLHLTLDVHKIWGS